MASLNGFDANNVEPSTNLPPVPAGKYLAIITASELRPTKNGAGRYLELKYQVIEGEFKGRKLWSRHTLEHPNAQTVTIARSQLSAICRAVQMMTPKDSGEMHNIPMVITVKVATRSDNGEPTNEVTGWAKKEAIPSVTQPAPAGTPASPPWVRR